MHYFSKAQNNLIVLKVPLNGNQSISQIYFLRFSRFQLREKKRSTITGKLVAFT